MDNKIRVAVNGFGRIGRMFLRLAMSRADSPIEIAAINDLGRIEALAHIVEFDSIQGKWNAAIDHSEDYLEINGVKIPFFQQGDPSDLPWKSLGIDIVLESTGKFKTADTASRHIEAGAQKVIISAVAATESIKTIAMGANEHILDGTETIISNASCTTNCAAPLVEVVDKLCGIESGYITTVHSYTSDQSLHDRSHTDLRRARAAALSIIPTSTGAAKAITRIFPHLDGKLGGAGIRVPVPNGSLTDITYVVNHPTDVTSLNEAFSDASKSVPWAGILEYTEKPLVSSDIIGNQHSCIFDAKLSSVIGNMVKVVGWYDNEMGYSARIIDLMVYWSKLWDLTRKP